MSGVVWARGLESVGIALRRMPPGLGWIAIALASFAAGCGKSEESKPGDDGARGGSAGAAAGAGSGGAGKGGLAGAAGGAGKGGSGGAASGGTSGAGRAGSAGSTASGGESVGGSAGSQSDRAGAAGEAAVAGSPGLPSGIQALAVSFCRAARNCCGAVGQPMEALESCESGFPSYVNGIQLTQQGTVTLDDATLSDCTEAFERAAVNCTLEEVERSCHGIFVGTLAEGEPCTDVSECRRDEGPTICKIVQSGSDPNVGVCADPGRGTLGTPCAQSCEVGADCSTTSISGDDTAPTALCYEEDGLYCPIGETCAEVVTDGVECTWHEACGSDGFCDSNCRTLAGLGDDCDFNWGCEAGLMCDGGECVPEPFVNSYTCVGQPPSID